MLLKIAVGFPAVGYYDCSWFNPPFNQWQQSSFVSFVHCHHKTFPTKTAADQLSTEVVDNFEEYFANINVTEQLHFTFEEDARLLLRETIDEFVGEVNTAIKQGQIPPKSKCQS